MVIAINIAPTAPKQELIFTFENIVNAEQDKKRVALRQHKLWDDCAGNPFATQEGFRNHKEHAISHRIHGAAIYGNIYHQYTPNVSIYTSTMVPMPYGRLLS